MVGRSELAGGAVHLSGGAGAVRGLAAAGTSAAHQVCDSALPMCTICGQTGKDQTDVID